jgi:hypothetical protein
LTTIEGNKGICVELTDTNLSYADLTGAGTFLVDFATAKGEYKRP